MALEVQVKTVEPQPIISITRHVKVDQLGSLIRNSLNTLYTAAEQQGASTAGAPFGIYHEPINHDDDGPIEICVPVERTTETSGDVTAREMPGGKFASVMLHGEQCEFPAILAGYDAVHDWIRQNGYEAIDAPREIWHSKPEEPHQMEIGWLFREAASS